MGSSEQTETQSPNFLERAKKAIDRYHEDFGKIARARIIPILLTAYDEVSLREIEEIKLELIMEGYVNSILIKDLPTESDFTNDLDSKYLHSLHVFNDEELFAIPIFYFPPKGRGNSLGHHGELIDLIMMFPSLVFRSGVFYYGTSEMLHHARIIPRRHLVNNHEEHKKEVINFVDSFIPFVERHLISKSIGKDFYSTKEFTTLRGDIDGPS